MKRCAENENDKWIAREIESDKWPPRGGSPLVTHLPRPRRETAIFENKWPVSPKLGRVARKIENR